MGSKSADPNSLSSRSHNASLKKKLRAIFTRQKQNQTGGNLNEPENHQSLHQETGHLDAPLGSPSRPEIETDLVPHSQSPQVPSFSDGVKVLHDCDDATVDVCFVHGLSGNRVKTWTARGQSKPWPEALLPQRLARARVLTYGYDAYIIRKSTASVNGLLQHATNLLNDLTTDRDANAPSRPLIFVAHSLGGLVCKEAILLSRNNPEPHLRGIFDCTKGIAFLGTPHRGAWIANWARLPVSALGIVKSTNTLLGVLRTDDKYLQSVQVRFCSMVRELQNSGRDFEVTCFYEELPIPGIGKVVSEESATLESYTAMSIHADHRDMVKFGSVEDNGFRRLLGELIRWEARVRSSAATQLPPPELIEELQFEATTRSFYNNYGSGDQFNAPGGTQNINKGSGMQFPGCAFNGSVHFGRETF